MGLLKDIGQAAGTGAVQGVQSGSAAATGGLLGEIFGTNKRAEKRQLENQQKLNQQAAELNYQMGEKAAQNAFERTKEMNQITYEQESWQNQVDQMIKAGLNPGIMAGGQGGGAGSANAMPQAQVGAQQAGRAANSAERMQAQTASIMAGAQMGLLQSQKELNEANAAKARADASAASESAQTTNALRDAVVNEMTQRGRGQWIDNMLKEWAAQGHGENEIQSYRSKFYGNFDITSDGNFNQKQAAEVGAMLADAAESTQDAEASRAMAALNNARTTGYWTELLNATKSANADMMRASAMKLSSEWQTGEFTNWKTWAYLGIDGVQALATAFGQVTGGMKNISTSKTQPPSGKTITTAEQTMNGEGKLIWSKLREQIEKMN